MGESNAAVFELTLPSQMDQVTSVHELAGQASRAFGLTEELSQWVELAISESEINAIQHDNGGDPSKEVFLSISSNGNQIEIIVEDQGSGFDLKDIADPTAVENLLKPYGCGVLIIRSFMDTVEVIKLKNGGSRLKMVKNNHGSQPLKR